MPKCDFNKSNFIKITLRHGCYPVNLMNILRRHQVGKGIPNVKHFAGICIITEKSYPCSN